MFKKQVAILLAALLILGASVVQAGSSEPSTRVFDDEVAFWQAVEQRKQEVPGQAFSGDASARSLEISRALSEPNLSREELESLAEAYDLLILQPGSSDTGVGIMASDAHNLHPIQAPTITFDSLTQETGFSGRIKWKDDWAIKSDIGFGLIGSPVGGPDAIGMLFSNISNVNQVSSYVGYTFDALGGFQRTLSNAKFNNRHTSGEYALVFEGQDRVLNLSSEIYDWYEVAMWVWFRANWNDHGNAQLIYSHTWESTSISSWGFGLNAGQKFGADFWVQWTSSQYRWATTSPIRSY